MEPLVSQADIPESVRLLPYAVWFSSEENDEHMEEGLKQHIEGVEQHLKMMLEVGLGPFRQAPLEYRRGSFMRITDTQDLNLLFTDDCVKKVAFGERPPPVSIWWQAIFTMSDFVAMELVKQFRRDFRAFNQIQAEALGVDPDKLLAVAIGTWGTVDPAASGVEVHHVGV